MHQKPLHRFGKHLNVLNLTLLVGSWTKLRVTSECWCTSSVVPSAWCLTLQRVRGGLCQSATVWLHQRTADGDQGAPSVRQRRLQRGHVVELDRGEAADETFRSRLHHVFAEVVRSYRGAVGRWKYTLELQVTCLISWITVNKRWREIASA